MQYVVLLVLAAIMCAALAAVALRTRANPGADAFAALALALCVWSFGYAFELLVPGLPAKLFWAKFQYLGIAALPAAWVAFALRHTRTVTRLTLGQRVLLSIEPLLVVILFWTNEWHGLFWQTIDLVQIGELTAVKVTYGPGFWSHIAVVYLALISGTVLLARMFLRSGGLYRRQSGAILLGALIPWISNGITLSQSGQARLDLTPIAFSLTALITGWALLRYQLLDLVPTARDLLVERMDDGVLVLDQQLRVIDLNEAACRIIGRPVRDLIGQPAARLLLPFGTALLGPNTPTEGHREQVVTAEPVPRVFDLSSTPLHDRSGRPIGRLVVLHDVSDLYLAKEAAEEADRAKSAFLATVTHELRTPLQVILGYTDLIRRDMRKAGAEQSVDDLTRIEQASAHLLDRINDVLDLSSIEAGELALTPAPCRVAELVEQALAEVGPQIAARQNRLEIDLPPEVGELHTDPRRLRRVLVHILDNAAKFTQSGTIALRVRRGEDGVCPDCVEFRVADTGIGMSEEQLGQVFQLFRQIDSSSTRQYGGMGLGLALSQRLCRLLGGELRATSQPGQGTTVTIRVPARLGA
ncbi:MAG: histidine kinase N-terminal 7TM domain-containing protein [Roseiflexaceae bacterium]